MIFNRENAAKCSFHHQERKQGDPQNRPACVQKIEPTFQPAKCFAHALTRGGIAKGVRVMAVAIRPDGQGDHEGSNVTRLSSRALPRIP